MAPSWLELGRNSTYGSSGQDSRAGDFGVSGLAILQLLSVVGAVLRASRIFLLRWSNNVNSPSPHSHMDSSGPWESYLSYSIELASFPEWAGNRSHPNSFTNNLLGSLAQLQGSEPYIRVGGNTMDRTTWKADQESAMIGEWDDNYSRDQPFKLGIGPAFFESYEVIPDAKVVHGFNMRAGGNSTKEMKNVIDHAVYACNALGDRIEAWEYGNEPDLFGFRHHYRDPEYNEQDVFNEWEQGADAITAALKKYCPKCPSPGYIAPSFAFNQVYMNPVKAWFAGYDRRSDISMFAQHNYVGLSDEPGLTLQRTLLNHTHTAWILANHTRIMAGIGPRAASAYIISETNSLAKQGKPFISDTFGSSLWNLDFALHAASIGVRRLHMHQGIDYRYSSWQAVETDQAVRATKPPFYGNVATADFIGDVRRGHVQVFELGYHKQLGMRAEFDMGYGLYVVRVLEKVAMLNMRASNITQEATRPEKKYSIVVPSYVQRGRLRRLIAGGSDAYSGVSYGGYSYNLELDEGKPVRLGNVTDVEEVRIVEGGVVTVVVPDASAVVVALG